MLLDVRMRNTNRNVTGMLLKVDDSFVHYLDGPKDEVGAIFAQLLADKRHGEVIKLHEGPIRQRLVPHWSMAFQEIALPSTSQGAFGAMLKRILQTEAAPAVEGAGDSDWMHRFWTECAASLPR
jgi:hypothetical protein